MVGESPRGRPSPMLALMFLPNPRLLALLASTCLLACASDETGLDADTDTSESESGAATETGANDEFGDTDDEPLSEIPALGIQITEVEANQGTAVFVGRDGEWVDGPDRLGPLISKRNMLIRVHYTVDPGWVARDIQAQLVLTHADGTTKTFAQTKTVDGDSVANMLSGAFYFGLVAEDGDVEAGTSYRVTLQEVDEASAELAAGAGLSEGTWETPREPGPLGIQAEPLQLKVVFVPYHHVFEGIDRTTDTSDATMKILVDALYEQNPTHELIWSVHEPVLWPYEMTSLGAVLGPMSAMRENELAFPNEYWAGIFPVPNGGVAGVAGVAQVPGPGKGEGGSRVSVTALGNNPSGAAGTLVHEVGHTQGLNHVYCPFAEAASPDPSYPYENGLLGQWGFGLLSFKLYAPDSHYDYMSYCGPSWVSTWSWSNNFFRIRELTSWEFEDVGPDDQRPILVGSIAPDGSEFWWTLRGSLPSDAGPFGVQPPQSIELWSGGESIARPSVVRVANDFSTTWVMTELPEQLATLEGIDQIVRVDAQLGRHVVPAERVTKSARPLQLAAP